MSLKSLAILHLLLYPSCGNNENKQQNLSVDAIRKEINKTREQFWSYAQAGNLDSMLSFHLGSSAYKLYNNGLIYDYSAQTEGHKKMQSEGIISIDFHVQVKDSIILNKEQAFETWDGTTTTSYNSGKKDTTERFIVTILYQKAETGWKFRYLHSSSKKTE